MLEAETTNWDFFKQLPVRCARACGVVDRGCCCGGTGRRAARLRAMPVARPAGQLPGCLGEAAAVGLLRCLRLFPRPHLPFPHLPCRPALPCPAPSHRGELFAKDTVRGSQFQPPLMEFSGACEGCGETPYVKLLTQLFGTRMLIANATGCSSIWGGSAPANPYTTDFKGRGPAWANSLFEDNAQFGFGIAMGVKQRRAALEAAAKVVVGEGAGTPELRAALAEWLPIKDNGALAGTAAAAVAAALPAANGNGNGNGTVVSEAARGALAYIQVGSAGRTGGTWLYCTHSNTASWSGPRR